MRGVRLFWNVTWNANCQFRVLVLFVHCTLRLLTHWSAESHVLIVIEIHTRLRGFQYL